MCSDTKVVMILQNFGQVRAWVTRHIAYVSVEKRLVQGSVANRCCRFHRTIFESTREGTVDGQSTRPSYVTKGRLLVYEPAPLMWTPSSGEIVVGQVVLKFHSHNSLTSKLLPNPAERTYRNGANLRSPRASFREELWVQLAADAWLN